MRKYLFIFATKVPWSQSHQIGLEILPVSALPASCGIWAISGTPGAGGADDLPPRHCPPWAGQGSSWCL